MPPPRGGVLTLAHLDGLLLPRCRCRPLVTRGAVGLERQLDLLSGHQSDLTGQFGHRQGDVIVRVCRCGGGKSADGKPDGCEECGDGAQ